VIILKDVDMTNFIITKKDKKSYEGKILSLPSATKHNKQYAVKFFERFTCEKYKKSLFGYGVSAKGNVLLNYCKIDNTILL
jgi:hypothetical protein